MLIYILYCSPETWVVILESTSLYLLIILMLFTQKTPFLLNVNAQNIKHSQK